MKSIANIVIATLLVLCTSGCSESESNETENQETSRSADSEGTPFSCEAPSRWVLGSPVDAAQGCVDTDSTEQVACATSEQAALSDPHHCLQRKSDGVAFFFASSTKVTFDAQKWQACSEPWTRPAACFVKSCERAPFSLCSSVDTRERFGCGGEHSEWDESCCARKGCESNDDCDAGQECKEIPTIASTDCWRTSGSPCDCAGTLGGIEKKLCF